MACGCAKHKDRDGNPLPATDAHWILPSTPCVQCAEKHLDYAYHLSKEVGYTVEDRADIVGALVAAQWHVHTFDMGFAERLRDARHLVQERKESSIAWKPLLQEMDELARKELRT